MTEFEFKRVGPNEARILDNEDAYIGDLYRRPDFLKPDAHYYVVHLHEDPRGFVRVHDRRQVRAVTAQRIATHPYWSY